MFISTGNKKDNFKYSNPSLAVEILSDLAESIRKPLPKASNTETEYFDESLVRIDRGKSFKGHEAQVHISNNKNNTTLSVSNKYLGGHIGYYYNVNQNVTEMSLIVDFPAPKWYTNKVLDIKKLYKIINGVINIKLDQTKSIEIAEYGANLNDRTETIGLVMYGHRRNIGMITENRHILSKFRKWFKGVDINHLEFREIDTKNEYSTKTWQITNFKI
tara:strand:+ start:289 stop:939 length:651 start_codon:yes stop_codon:yes gene_type:complete